MSTTVQALAFLLLALLSVGAGIIVGLVLHRRLAPETPPMKSKIAKRLHELTGTVADLVRDRRTDLYNLLTQFDRLPASITSQFKSDVLGTVERLIETNKRLEHQVANLKRQLAELDRSSSAHRGKDSRIDGSVRIAPCEKDDSTNHDALLAEIGRRSAEHCPIEETLEFLYNASNKPIPFARIGLAKVTKDGQFVESIWQHSHRPTILKKGFSAAMKGSSLQFVANKGRPRMLNDLVEYLRSRPQSISTRMLVEEGYRSSLTCPLSVRGQIWGFLFFSSDQRNAYRSQHVDCARRIAELVSQQLEAWESVVES